MECTWSIGVSTFCETEITAEATAVLDGVCQLSLDGSLFSAACRQRQCAPGQTLRICEFTAEDSALPHGRFFISAEFSDYQDDWFIFMPSACYDGNRFQMISTRVYPPLILKDYIPADPLNPPVVMKEIPAVGTHFNRKVTDASAPLLGIFMPDRGESIFIQLEQGTSLGTNGVEIAISDQKTLCITLSLPCVRTRSFAAARNTDDPPPLPTGTTVRLEFITTHADTPALPDFYRQFATLRNGFPAQPPLSNRRAFSHTADIILDMFESARWHAFGNFYMKNRDQERLEMGWVALPELTALFRNGSAEARKHVMAELENIFAHAVLPSGFFKSVAQATADCTAWLAGGVPLDNLQNGCLARVQIEILHYTLKMLVLLEADGMTVPEDWKQALHGLADALAAVWTRYRQWGFALNLLSSEILIGGSFSGALAPAAFLLAASYFKDATYNRIAKDSARYFCDLLTSRGFSYGGPGDAMFAPDSESAFSLLESLTELAETTGEASWLRDAEFCADYCASWVPAVKYAFETGSAYDRMDMDCRGAVQANLQNQHGAPAPCINSAVSLLKLYRMTGNRRYILLLRDIVHNCVQYISTVQHPIPMVSGVNLPVGDASEKVMFQDFAQLKGNIPGYGGGGWTEIAILLCITENPGVYCCPERHECVVLDHVDARLDGRVLSVTNPFSYPISLNMLVESEQDRARPLGLMPFRKYTAIQLAAGVTRTIPVN